MTNTPKHQGELDGLCGPYAIANAISFLAGEDRFNEIFQEACRGLASSRWPQTIWEGTTFGDLKKMISRCKKNIEDLSCFKFSYPFLRKTPKTNSDYWLKFDDILNREPKQCAIIGITRPSMHWIVVSSSGEKIKFRDSTATSRMYSKPRTSLYAGERNSDKEKWMIDRQELILISYKKSNYD